MRICSTKKTQNVNFYFLIHRDMCPTTLNIKVRMLMSSLLENVTLSENNHEHHFRKLDSNISPPFVQPQHILEKNLVSTSNILKFDFSHR